MKLEIDSIDLNCTFLDLKGMIDKAFPNVPYDQLEIEIEYWPPPRISGADDPPDFKGLVVTKIDKPDERKVDMLDHGAY